MGGRGGWGVGVGGGGAEGLFSGGSAAVSPAGCSLGSSRRLAACPCRSRPAQGRAGRAGKDNGPCLLPEAVVCKHGRPKEYAGSATGQRIWIWQAAGGVTRSGRLPACTQPGARTNEKSTAGNRGLISARARRLSQGCTPRCSLKGHGKEGAPGRCMGTAAKEPAKGLHKTLPSHAHAQGRAH